eukprot:symbB.v1.2.036948.t1/scaffold5338.1/size28299/1
MRTRMRRPVPLNHQKFDPGTSGHVGSEEDDRILMPMAERGQAMSPAPDLRPVGCGACGNVKAKLVCHRCKGAMYCDEICQRRDLPRHRMTCESAEVGDYCPVNDLIS